MLFLHRFPEHCQATIIYMFELCIHNCIFTIVYSHCTILSLLLFSDTFSKKRFSRFSLKLLNPTLDKIYQKIVNPYYFSVCCQIRSRDLSYLMFFTIFLSWYQRQNFQMFSYYRGSIATVPFAYIKVCRHFLLSLQRNKKY